MDINDATRAGASIKEVVSEMHEAVLTAPFVEESKVIVDYSLLQKAFYWLEDTMKDSEPIKPSLSADTIKNDKYLCRCGATIEKKFDHYCANCGHPLDWSNVLRWK